MGLPRLRSGDSLASTVHSAQWVNRVLDAVDSKPGYSAGYQNLKLLPYIANGTPTFIGAYGVCGAMGIDPVSAPASLPEPIMQATLGRSHFLYYTGLADNHGEGTLVVSPIPEYPILVRAKEPGAGYQRKFIPGLPCGRAIDTDTISADEGGLILVTKPYREGTSGAYWCWVMRDTVKIWDAVIVVQSGTLAPTDATNFLTGRGTYVAALLNRDPSTVPADALKDVVTKYRCDVHPRDPDETYEDGIHVKIAYNNGEWKVLWSSCEAISGLTGLTKEPA